MKDRTTILKEAIQPKINNAFSGEMGAAVALELAQACNEALDAHPHTKVGMPVVPLGTGTVALVVATHPQRLTGCILFKALPDDLIGKRFDDIRLSDLPNGPETQLVFNDLDSLERLMEDLHNLHNAMVEDQIKLEDATVPSKVKVLAYIASCEAENMMECSDASIPKFKQEALELVEEQASVSDFRSNGWDDFADFVMEEVTTFNGGAKG